MKFDECKVGMKVEDGPSFRGVITEVMKTRVKVRFHGEDEDTVYDQHHIRFLNKRERFQR